MPCVDMESVNHLGDLLRDARLAEAVLCRISSSEAHALIALAQQSIHCGIDYSTLGLGWDHPTARTLYWKGEGQSFSNPHSRQRQMRSRKAMVDLSKAMLSATDDAAREALLVAAFCKEISTPIEKARNARFNAVAAALGSDLLLPLRALQEGFMDMTQTFAGMPVPHEPLQQALDAVVISVLEGRFSEWRYCNPCGRVQLNGLSEHQVSVWRDATVSKFDNIIVHEDAPGELGLFWATKIGGPSHGFDFGGQCLLPLLCNARHKVILVSCPSEWPHPCGRAHFRLLWIAGTDPPKPVLWLEVLNVDFAARRAGIDTEGWQEAVLMHAVDKATDMKIALSVDAKFGQFLTELSRGNAGSVGGEVREVRDRLILRPSNGVLEASDYLSNKHDWVQMVEEITEPLRRVVYDPIVV